jgi:hypothetical protein
MLKTFEEIKSEYLRLNQDLLQLEEQNSENFSFEEVQQLVKIKARLEHEIADKIRLMNDLQSLRRIELK